MWPFVFNVHLEILLTFQSVLLYSALIILSYICWAVQIWMIFFASNIAIYIWIYFVSFQYSITPSKCYNIMTYNVWIMSFYVDDTGNPLKHDINWCNVASTKSIKNHNFSQVAIRWVDSIKPWSCLLTIETTWNIFKLVSAPTDNISY